MICATWARSPLICGTWSMQAATPRPVANQLFYMSIVLYIEVNFRKNRTLGEIGPSEK